MSPSSLLSFCVLALSLAACSTPATDVRLPALFTDHMVLQRDVPVTVWGRAAPGGTVTASLDGHQAGATVETDSTWRLTLPPMPAGGPHTLTVVGAETTTVNDVLVGDVWIASGQSNMEWPLRTTNDAEAAIQAANYPNIRIFNVANLVAYTPQDDVRGEGWHPVTPETIRAFSAVAYYFGRDLQQELDVPIGLLGTNWGGTPAEAWTSGPVLKKIPDFAEAVAEIEAAARTENGQPAKSVEAQRMDWLAGLKARDRGYEQDHPRWAEAAFDDAGWPTMEVPQRWEGAGLPGYDGIVWFRKAFDLPAAWQGRDLMLHLAMVDDVDTTWVNGVKVGSTSPYNEHRAYTVPASALQPGRNVITVRVLDTGGGGGIWGEAADLYLASGTDRRSLAGPWAYQTALAAGDEPPRPPQNLQNQPTTLFNAMIAPLLPFAIRGAIWYQGESNAGRAYQYRTLFPAMIQDWRDRWGLGDFPFLFVQLANFMAPQQNPVEAQTWPELREAQHQTLSLPNTGEAVIIDIGEADDIHPRNKKDVGHRLALAALKVAYGQDVGHSGPSYRGMTREGNTIRLHFDHVGGGLVARGGMLQGFAVAGADRRFVWADATIDGETIVVSSPSVAEPEAVRYAWADNPLISLYNAEGLPATPFRTDDWPGVTEPER